MAHEQQKPVADVAASGSYLPFFLSVSNYVNNMGITIIWYYDTIFNFVVISIRTRFGLLSLSLGSVATTRSVNLVESILLHASPDRVGQSGNICSSSPISTPVILELFTD